MFPAINRYLSKQGVKYIKPEKAGPHEEEMRDLKVLGQAARKEMQVLSQSLEKRLTPFAMTRVSNWANQAQVCRPHFWTYFYGPEDQADDVGLAIRLYGETDAWGISVEVSFVERHRSDQTLSKQAKVLNLPIQAPLYYLAQEEGESRPYDGNEANRKLLQGGLKQGRIRKVLVKYNVSVTQDMNQDQVLDQLLEGFKALLPYYDNTKD